MPPRGEQFCTICAAVVKQAAMIELKEAIGKALLLNGETTQFDLRQCKAFSQGIPLAVATSLFQPMMIPPLGSGMCPFPIPLCWTHLLGLTLQESAVMPATPAMMPVGPGGAVMLDRR
jgi:hypothetical protein